MGWIGVDLDGTLAHWPPPAGQAIGPPVPAMRARVLRWLRLGQEVRIFTVRAGDPDQIPRIAAWLHRHGMAGLAITNVKAPGLIELWDDRAVRVRRNTGMPCCNHAARQALEDRSLNRMRQSAAWIRRR